MKILIALVLSTIPIFAIAQAECPDIKQDKARLKCYDDREKFSREKVKENIAATQQRALQDDVEFKRLASIFIRDAQANLTLAALQWQNFMDAPSAKPVQEILASNKKIQSDVTGSFNSLMSTPGKTDPLADKIKDYFAAWGIALATIRPTSSDSSRGFATRLNGELARMGGLSERLKMDL